MIGARDSQRIEYGDFQTPAALAAEVCKLLADDGLKPDSVLEPTCGKGSFLVAALRSFPSAHSVLGVELNPDYVTAATEVLAREKRARSARVVEADFFAINWQEVLEGLTGELLVLGNPPWVTNAALGRLGGLNLPEKSNFQRRRGFDAKTGKSNFDISEWMLLQILDWVDRRPATIAMLCKTAVARKVLLHAWRHDQQLKNARIFQIDAKRHFGASVDACLFVCHSSETAHVKEATIYTALDAARPSRAIGYRNGRLLADLAAYERWKHLAGQEESHYRWRSGVKHDCAKVMELWEEGGRYQNGLGDKVDIEGDLVFPMLKSSEVARYPDSRRQRWMLVTQRAVGEDTSKIERQAPLTWRYLERNGDRLDARRSSIYQKQPRFSIFGVGDYTFAPWKVAISGFYKKLEFKVIEPKHGKPTVLDDTCYFLACETRDEAEYLGALLNSQPAREFLGSFVFWDAKRPITVDVLRRLDLFALAQELGSEETMRTYLGKKPNYQGARTDHRQLALT